MAKLSALRVDPELTEEGRWVDYELGIRLRIARHNNSRYQAYFMKLMRDNPEVQEDTESFSNLLKVAVGRTILRDWEGVEDDAGKKLKYTDEVGEKIITDPAYQDLYQFVLSESQATLAYRENAAGNSENSSTGTSSGEIKSSTSKE